MDSIKMREQKFHNRIFQDNSRERVNKFYSITNSSRQFYQSLLLNDCIGNKALEYGCGEDNSSYLLAQNGVFVTGIDISDVAIQKSREKASIDKISNITFFKMDAENMTLPDQSFDLICGTGILHHLNLQRAYSEIVRVLKPGGKAIFLEPLGHNPFINIYRALTPSLRSADEHPLKMTDLSLSKLYFKNVKMHYFHLFGLLGVPFRNFFGFSILCKLLDTIDKLFFIIFPFFRRFAWTVVIVLTDPNSSNPSK